VPDLHAFATARGFVRRGGELDYHNAAHSYIRAFNEGAFGRISLEAPDDTEAA
jgi:ribosome biogenesis GTPase A